MENYFVDCDPCLHSKFENGKVTFGTYESSECANDAVDDVVCAWANGESATIEHRFTIQDCIQDMIEFHIYTSNGRMDPDMRAAFVALRVDLMAAVATIDSLKYADEA